MPPTSFRPPASSPYFADLSQLSVRELMLTTACTVMKIFYAMLIPYLWRQKGWSPVLVDTDSNCDSTDAVDHLPDENSKVCVDGKRYYLIRPGDNGAMDCSQRSDHWSEKCVLSNVENMNGFAQLNGDAWAGLRKEDLAGRCV